MSQQCNDTKYFLILYTYVLHDFLIRLKRIYGFEELLYIYTNSSIENDTTKKL